MSNETGKTGTKRCENNFDTENLDQITTKLNHDLDKCYANSFKNLTNKKIYFAGPWFDDKSRMLYATCKAIETILRDVTQVKVFYPMDEPSKSPRQVFNKNVKELKKCDIVVALVSKKDVGTAWEIGMGYALGKEIYLLGYDETTFLSHTNLMLAFTGKCLTIDKYADFLLGKHVKFVNIPNLWEGIE